MSRVEKLALDVEAFLAEMNGGNSLRVCAKDEVVFSQGDLADAVFYIQEGQVNLRVVSEQGKEAIVALLDAGSFLGEACLAGQERRLATAVTATKSVIIRLERSTIFRVIHEKVDFAEMFIAHLLDRTIRVEADLVDQLFNSSEKRLARLLLLMANFGQNTDFVPVIPKPTQETLAQMIGTTRARVSGFMNKFRELGLIEYNGGIKVHKSLLNIILHDEPGIKKRKAP